MKNVQRSSTRSLLESIIEGAVRRPIPGRPLREEDETPLESNELPLGDNEIDRPESGIPGQDENKCSEYSDLAERTIMLILNDEQLITEFAASLGVEELDFEAFLETADFSKVCQSKDLVDRRADVIKDRNA